ncbi:MAG: DNA-3-methyladenine glycosylase 2 family protein [Actinobacteria bacterium]|nr:DNA-3-methyladenine glycosylase 2 family protein [Actinomycetota bacterium]MBI3687850.1 DNA-3-methyladenine glycosylase 2 family protein [Actinomycetota bacterium]
MEWRPGWPVDLQATLGVLRRGGSDPAHRFVAGELWRVALTPDGPATLLLRVTGGVVSARAWGPGAAWTIDGVPELLGARDDLTGFTPEHPRLRDSWRRHPGLRIPRTRLVLDQLIPAILEQKVTGAEARRSWRELCQRYGEPAPGPVPAGMRVPPAPTVLGRLSDADWHRAGVTPQRRHTLRRACLVADRLEEAVGMPPAGALARLRAVPGIGAWTAAEVAQRALGDADAVSVGDFHLPALVGWALTGRPLDDPAMLRLLAPYAPHRHRVVRLIELSGVRKPRFGPRLPARDYRAM